MSRTVEDLMTRIAVNMPADATIVEAAQAMRERQIGDVLVIDGGMLLGVVTDRDIVVRAVAEQKDPVTTPLGEIVSREPVRVPPYTSAAQALEVMGQRAVRRLAVMEPPGTLVGVVSIGDLLGDPDADLAVKSTLSKISAAPPNN